MAPACPESEGERFAWANVTDVSGRNVLPKPRGGHVTRVAEMPNQIAISVRRREEKHGGTGAFMLYATSGIVQP